MNVALDNRTAAVNAQAAYARERRAQRRLMALKRSAGRDLIIPPISNERRRRRALRDPPLFMRVYMPSTFSNPFTADQRERIAAIVARMRHGGLHAIAAPRGDGKTSTVHGLIVWAIVGGVLKFPVLIGPNAPHATQRLDGLRAEFEANDLLADDWPEICTPIRALEGAHQRALSQTVGGRRTHLRWAGNWLVFPTVPGSAASGTITTAAGIDGAIRGLIYQGRRPDFILIDDCETRESVRSPTETQSRRDAIEKDLAGLAGQERALAIVQLCTIMRRDCLADEFTDPARKASWAGKRYAQIVTPPERADLWDAYVDLRQRAQLAGDEHGRGAQAFYAENRRAMDSGAVLSNPYRFWKDPLPTGGPAELSALQHCFNLIADLGREAFETEYQNAPPAEEAAESMDITVPMVMQKLSGRPRGTCPPGTDMVTAGIDIGGRVLHWAALAWTAGRAEVIDYGTTPVPSPLEGGLLDAENLQAVQDAILTALLQWRDEIAPGWPEEGQAEPRPLDLCLIDAGWQDAPVYELARATGGRVFRAAKGYGTGSGQARYRHPTQKGHGRRVGVHWHATRQPAARAWLYNLDADFWKSYVHAGFMTPAARPNSLALFGGDPLRHRNFALQITAEVWTREFVTGRGSREYWDQRRKANHWLDATAMACAAAGVLGLRLVAAEPDAATQAARSAAPKPKRKLRLSEIQAAKRQGRM